MSRVNNNTWQGQSPWRKQSVTRTFTLEKTICDKDIHHVTFIMWQVTFTMWHSTCDIHLVTFNMWQVTFTMWHSTCDMWHSPCDIQHVTCDIHLAVWVSTDYHVTYVVGDTAKLQRSRLCRHRIKTEAVLVRDEIASVAYDEHVTYVLLNEASHYHTAVHAAKHDSFRLKDSQTHSTRAAKIYISETFIGN